MKWPREAKVSRQWSTGRGKRTPPRLSITWSLRKRPCQGNGSTDFSLPFSLPKTPTQALLCPPEGTGQSQPVEGGRHTQRHRMGGRGHLSCPPCSPPPALGEDSDLRSLLACGGGGPSVWGRGSECVAGLEHQEPLRPGS